mgnify:CR=1 FL=1
MKIEIDQSGHVEYTSHPTIVADSLGHAVHITTKTKKSILQIYRLAGKPRVYVYETFSLLIAIVIRKTYARENLYIVDTEYSGKSDIIKNLTLKFLHKMNIPITPQQIDFGHVKQGSPSDATAHTEFLKINRAELVSLQKILSLLLQ